NSKTWHDDKWLTELAKSVGASDSVSKCIKDKKYINMVKELGPKLNIQATPTIRINGKDWEIGKGTTPADLIKAVTDITGPVPGLP
ncbi:MAG: DsbA family protein, partial [[Mycobacterium] stephanolepidis]